MLIIYIAMKILILFVFVLSSGILHSQNINYNHKSIAKELERIWNYEGEKEEMSLINSESMFEGKYFNLQDVGYVYVGRVKSCRVGGCSIEKETNGPREYFDYFICFNKKGVVQDLKVFNYAATHGQEVSSRGWLKQFIGFSSKQELEVGKNIDSISGATISVYAITDDIQLKTQFLAKKLKKNYFLEGKNEN